MRLATFVSLLVAVMAVDQSPDKTFFESDSFLSAMVGEARSGTSRQYVRAKLEAASRQRVTVSLTMLEDACLMADRRFLNFWMPGLDETSAWRQAAVDSRSVIEARVTDVVGATRPAKFRRCLMELSKVETSLPAEVKFDLRGIDCDFEASFGLTVVEGYAGNYYAFMVAFVLLVGLQVAGLRLMLAKAKRDTSRYMRRVSLLGLLVDACLTSSLTYHVGVLLPADGYLLAAQVILMVHASLFWMRKLVHHANNPLPGGNRVWQFACMLSIMVGGLYIPSLDRRCFGLLLAVLLPLACQVVHAFTHRTASFTLEYNLLFKVPQLLVVAYICSWPGHVVHLLPTGPTASAWTMAAFGLMTTASWLQKAVHPRCFITMATDRNRLQFRPKGLLCGDLVADPQAECSVCLCALHDTPLTPALVTACGHSFHEACLTNWLDRSESCPVCRQMVDRPEDCSGQPV